jgi:iron complex outermembrane recepter protein
MLFVKHIMVLTVLFTSIVSSSQNCNLVLQGVVRDADNGEGLGFAVIKLLNTDLLIQTNENGQFIFKNLCPGSYAILVKHIGCMDTVFKFELDKSKKVILKLPHNENNLAEVDVMDKRVDMKKTQAVDQLSAADLQKTQGQQLGEVLKNINGVTALNTGGTISKPMVHGMQGYRLLILNNGIRQEGQQWGNEHAPEIDVFMAKKISVIKGAAAIRYGSDAIAGVVLVEPDELPDTAAVTGEVNLAGLSNGRTGAASAMLQGNFDKVKHLSWRVQGSLKKSGTVKSPGYYLSNTGLEEKNFSYAWSYHRKKWGVEMYYSQFNTAIGIFKGSHIGNLTDLNTALQLKAPLDTAAAFTYGFDRPKQVVAHELIKGLAHYHFSSRWRAKIQYAWQYNKRQEYDLRRLTTAEKETEVVAPDLDLRITSQTLECLIEHDNIQSFRGMYGASYMHQVNVYEGRFFIPNFINNTWGAFITERYVRPHLEVEAGLRYDEKYLQSFFYKAKTWTKAIRQFNNVTYNGGVIWRPDSVFNLFFNAGSAWRAPAANELYSNGIHQGIAAIEKGNENLKTERCYNVSLNGLYKIKNFNAELTLYHNQFENFIYLDPANTLELTIRGAFPVFDYKQANARISGVDLKTEYVLNKYLSFIAKGMLVRAWNNSIHDYLIYMPADRGELIVKLSLPQQGVFSNNYFQVSNSFVARQWRVPVQSDFAPPPAGYHLLGFDIGTTLKIKNQKMQLNFSATNLLNSKYREYLDRFRYYCDAAGVSYNIRLTVPIVVYDKK